MKDTAFSGAVILCGLLLAGGAMAEPDFIAREEAAIDRLAALNAQALLCKDLDAVQRIKRAIIYGVPKRLDYGDRFEETTNARFLDLTRTGVSCPPPAALMDEVEAAEKHLDAVFADDGK